MERHFAYGVTRICRELPENLFVNYFASIGEAKPEPHLALLVNSIDYNSFNSSARSVLSLQIADEPENSSTIRVLIQQSSNEPMLQLVDYVLWTIQR